MLQKYLYEVHFSASKHPRDYFHQMPDQYFTLNHLLEHTFQCLSSNKQTNNAATSIVYCYFRAIVS